uniref:Uncharacterized protein n=1 Tax=Nelumbo nucifera TaxID=4432 RepID=A0A822YVI5_NELNU|nr:TPA_asm: hypothetical protein HUJ06_006763 [Nelumbo nucifera]
MQCCILVLVIFVMITCPSNSLILLCAPVEYLLFPLLQTKTTLKSTFNQASH